MELRLQPKPKVEILPANQGIVSRKNFFVKKKFEEIKPYFFSGHFIRNWKPKVELLYSTVSNETAIQYECDFNRDIQNCFVEDNAEEVYLRTPPPCFVVIGKFGKCVSKLSKELADKFGSVLIQVDNVINELLQTQTETSKILDRLLRLGVSLTLNFILALLSYVAHTAEARHRGYVLCGLPCIPQSYDLSADEQFNYLFTWDNKPTVFINVLFDDEDLIKERANLRCEIENLGDKKGIIFHTEKLIEEESDEEDTDDELSLIKEGRTYERDIDISPSRPWIQLPRDEESQVWVELELFDNKIRPAIELLISRVDPQYFITVDSRVHNELDVVLARLSLLQIWKVPVAVPFIPPKPSKAVPARNISLENLTEEEPEEVEVQSLTEYETDDGIKEIVKEPPQTAFLILFTKKTISPKYRWELSHYNYICPVTLRSGEIVEGKSEFAVFFMKYIYFLHDKEAMLKFIQNPRAYVLPIRPQPLRRFIILGYPYTGKTSLATALATEYSIPVLDANTILKNDLDRKKSIYQEFCRQKAECRETIRLNAQAWQDWRREEEQRVFLIEEWIIYIQTLLSQRIEQFYTKEESDGDSSKETQIQSCTPAGSSDNEELRLETRVQSEGIEPMREDSTLRVRGVALTATASDSNKIISSPSDKMLKVIKHDFNAPCLEFEANVFFSFIWDTFSNEGQENSSGTISFDEEEMGEHFENYLEVGKKSSYTVDWCGLLPPQSLSSFMMSKKSYTTREKRNSFKIFLEAASKVYWVPSKLKTEFVKWRLPCFMDIPLCEVFLDNPILLLKYVPEWLKERPLIPNPVDPMHPSILEAGRKAFLRAGVVTVKQDKEEIAILLRDAIEKAEREQMRLTGDIMSPGGWVMDNMTLDLEVWKKLACESVFADHIYILVDTDPEHQRIINTWCEINRTSSEVFENALHFEDNEEESQEAQMVKGSEEFKRNFSVSSRKMKSLEFDQENLIERLCKIVKLNANDDRQLDDIYSKLLDEAVIEHPYVPPLPVDVFSHHIFENNLETWNELKEDATNEETLLMVQTLTHYSITNFFGQRQIISPTQDTLLGQKLQKFGSTILNLLKKKPAEVEEIQQEKKSLAESLEFFIFLLSVPKKLKVIKEFLTSLGRGATVTEIEITGKTPESLLFDIRKALMEPFIKKPRELEEFEMKEVQKSECRQNKLFCENYETETEEEEEKEEEEEEEDLRIFGESGPLCIVNLERDIFLRGKPEFALRYYGKLYYFWNEVAKNEFMQNPQKYAPYYSVIRSYPPLRVYVTGPVGCGKTALASSIATQCSLTYVDYPKFLVRSLVPYLNTTSQKFSALGEHKLLLSEDHNTTAKLLKEQFMNAPHGIRQFWFENPIYEEELETKIKFRNKLINLNKPITPKNFPELRFKCIDSDINDNIQHPQETSFVSMKEIESIINNYFQNNSELTKYCTEKSIKTLWTTEPYLTQGFVLEGFPLRFSDVNQITENNWLPDLVFEVTLPGDVVIERNIDTLMELWSTKLKQEIIEEKSLEDALSSFQRICIHLRRNELIAEKRKAALAALAQPRAEESSEKVSRGIFSEKYPRGKRGMEENDSKLLLEMDKQIQAEVEETLSEEFPPMQFNPHFETYSAGKARITDNLLKSYRRDSGEIEKIKGALTDLGVPWFEVDSLKDLKENLINVFLTLDKTKKRISCKGEFAFSMKMETAEKLLEQGYYFLSKFGRWCPVQVYRMKNPIHMFRPFSLKGKITPIAYRNYIYFVGGENEKQKFIRDPVKYTFNEPRHPNIPLRVAIIGPPKSGKSTLSNRLAHMFDMKVITMGSALRFVLEKMPQSTLSKSINNYLRRGCFLPLSFKVEALVTCLNDPACVTQGYVFDGVPFDAALTQSLAERGKLPFVIISLVADSDFGKINRQCLDLKAFRLPYKNRVNLDSRYENWSDTYKRFAQWNRYTYNNLYEVNAKLNIVDIFYQTYDIIRKSFFGILYYVQYCVSDRALPLQYLCVGEHEYELRKSLFQNVCPVCWVEDKRLSSSPDPPPRSGLVQYLNFYYWICSKHMAKFLKHPKIYIPPQAPPPPHLLPKIITKAMFESFSPPPKIHSFGRCPVTTVDFPSVLDWEGSWDFAAYYGDEVFLCKSKDLLDRFLARPWRYCKADSKFEVNRVNKSYAVENLGPPKVTCLPPIGFLEQTVADSLHECLQILGAVRPIYPNMTFTTTGCTFIALYLKVNNRKKGNRELERQYFEFMLNNCKAYQFRVPPFKRLGPQIGQGDSEVCDKKTLDSESSDEDITAQSFHSMEQSPSTQGDQSGWLDLEAQADKKMWSAKVQRLDLAEMRLTVDDELQEILEVPKAHVVLKYQTYTLRSSPLPPISNCLTFLYSIKPPLEIREKFNYNTLYQPLPLFSTPYPPQINFNPEKEFSYPLYKNAEPSFPSQENLWKGKRVHSDDSVVPVKQNSDIEPDLELMIKCFVPRFQLLDKLTSVKVPSVPEVVQEKPIIFNPQRDYAYTLLLSEFFHTTHVLRCYEWDESHQQLERSNLLDKNLGLSNVQVEYFLHPHTTPSVHLRKSIDSYMEALDTATIFATRPLNQMPDPTDEKVEKLAREKSSLINFFQKIILEKLNELFSRVSLTALSYDSYEVNLFMTDSDTNEKQASIVIREILPYPPLSWDIISTPYYAYSAIPSIFQAPILDQIAHERHFSVLDGIIEQIDEMRFVRYPTWIQTKEEKRVPGVTKLMSAKKCKTCHDSKTVYVVYDFFNLYWTSFLTYPFSWAYNKDIKGHFCEFHDYSASPFCAQAFE